MTFGEKLREAGRSDPEFARAVLLNKAAVVMLGIAVAAAVAVGVVNYLALERVSACEKSPSSHRCQSVRRQTDAAQSIRDKCRNFWRVGYACPKPGTRADQRYERRRRSGQSTASPVPGAQGGEALQSPHTGSQQPGPHGGVGQGNDGGTGHQAPSGSGSAPAPEPHAAPESEASTAPTPAQAPATAAPPPPKQPVRETVEGVAGAAQETVEQVPATTCKLLGSC